MAHVLKTPHAAIREHRQLASHAEADLPLLAATRYVASPHRIAPVYDMALNAMKLFNTGAARSV